MTNRSLNEIYNSLSPEGKALFREHSENRIEQVITTEYETEDYNPTDLGNSQRLVDKHGEDIKYDWGNNYWLVWDGKRWCKDTGAVVFEKAKDTVKSIYIECANCDDTGRSQELAKHARSSESHHRIRSMVELAKSDENIRVYPDELDSNPMLFNCQNGTLDLRTGELIPHNKESLITRMSPIKFDPEAKCPEWDRHIKRVVGNNEELASYLQRVFGYCLTGSNREQVFFIVHGTSKTGKSVTLNTIRWLLGDYGASTPSETFLQRKNADHSDLARLTNSRMVTAIESDESGKINSPVMKAITGGDTMAVRLLYHERFETTPTYKVFIATNDKPYAQGEDTAIWERLRLIPFNQFIPVEERDKDIVSKLKEEGSGIFNWLLKGCLEWQKLGHLDEPEVVTEHTKLYQNEMDVITAFLDEKCVIQEESQVSGKELYEAFKEWSLEDGVDPITQNLFGRKLRKYNLSTSRGNKGRTFWKGLRLKTGDEEIEALKHFTPFSETISENFSYGKKLETTENTSTHAQKYSKYFKDGIKPPVENCLRCGKKSWRWQNQQWICWSCGNIYEQGHQ